MRTTGINHLVLVCRDMQETVFFDCGGGAAAAFFW